MRIMRTIKFRAWDGEKNRFFGEGEIIFSNYGETEVCVNPNSIDYIGDSVHNGEPQRGRFIVEQFTGLTDKNGKEIYEGDIVRILYTDWGSKLESDTRTLEQYLIDIASIGSIVFNENSWEVYFGLDKYGFDSYSNINPGKHGYIEVIGNINENPELL